MKYVLEVFFFDDGHSTHEFNSWDEILFYLSETLFLDDVFRLFVRVE